MTKFSYKIDCKTTTLLNKINITTYFENPVVEWHVLYTILIRMSNFVSIGYNLLYDL